MSSFERKPNLESPQTIRKKKFKRETRANQCEKEASRLIKLATGRKGTTKEEKELNRLDKQITTTMIKTESNK